MRVAEVVVRILESEGIEAAFGIPGAAINPTYEYLGASKKIKHYIARHEEGAVHAADGYFRACGKMALAICTSGPGGHQPGHRPLHGADRLHAADRHHRPERARPTGQGSLPVRGYRHHRPARCARAAWCITEPTQVPSIMREAFWTAREGRPGPVLIDLPLDVQMADIPYDPAIDAPLPIHKREPDRRADRPGDRHAAGRREARS